MERTVSDFCIPVLAGPTKEELDAAIRALWHADHLVGPSFAQINAGARAKGERPPYREDDDATYRSSILMKAYLRWILQGDRFKYRLKAQAKTIVKDGNDYIVEFRYYNRHTRTLVAYNPNDKYRLEANTDYDFRIVYNPTERTGHVSMLGRSE